MSINILCRLKPKLYKIGLRCVCNHFKTLEVEIVISRIQKILCRQCTSRLFGVETLSVSISRLHVSHERHSHKNGGEGK